MIHNLEHINRLKPLLYAFNHGDSLLVVTVFLELDKANGVKNLGDLDVDIVDIEPLKVLRNFSVSLYLDAVSDVLVIKDIRTDC
jgi:hypothetical protein